MACPFFMPQQKFENGSWPHPARLPLGAGWTGYCTAPGHEGAVPELSTLESGCNLGYASSCSRRPAERAWDSVRFRVTRTGERRVLVLYSCERDHRPATHGTLEYDITTAMWISSHHDLRIQRMAECIVESHLSGKNLASGSESEQSSE